LDLGVLAFEQRPESGDVAADLGPRMRARDLADGPQCMPTGEGGIRAAGELGQGGEFGHATARDLELTSTDIAVASDDAENRVVAIRITFAVAYMTAANDPTTAV
jgi:hypothetical protein